MRPYRSTDQGTYSHLGHAWFNWQFDNISDWYHHLRARHRVNDMLMLRNAVSLSDLTDRFGGVWASRGTDTLAGTTFNFYELTIQGFNNMAMPEFVPFWATNDFIDPISGSPNKRAPNGGQQNTGQISSDPNTIPTSQNVNWLLDTSRLWIEFLRDMIDNGSTHVTTDTGKTEAEVEVQFGGDWTLIGNDTLAGRPVRVFERTGV